MRVRQMHSSYLGRAAIRMAGQFIRTLGHEIRSLGWKAAADAMARAIRITRKRNVSAALMPLLQNRA